MESKREPIDLVPSYAFWMDGCATMTRYMLQMFELAEIEPSPERINSFLLSMPRVAEELTYPKWRQGYFNQCCEQAFTLAAPQDRARLEEICSWFLGYFVKRSTFAKEMLIDSVGGVFRGVNEARTACQEESNAG
jgi:hypothetical protein